ncbi:hypothetical protein D3C78_1902410 [compost metagenome]
MTTAEVLLEQGEERMASFDLELTRLDFQNEMRRFLPLQVVSQTVENLAFWEYVVTTVREHFNVLKTHLGKQDRGTSSAEFLM